MSFIIKIIKQEKYEGQLEKEMFVSVFKLSSFSTKHKHPTLLDPRVSEGTVIGSAGRLERETNEVEMNYTQPLI